MMTGRLGFCAFCGVGGGYLGEQGDDMVEILSASLRVGDGPDTWSYILHENALLDEDGLNQCVVWCGRCVGGLRHKFQRLDDHNLRAKWTAYELWREMDGIRWSVFFPNRVDVEAGNTENAGTFARDEVAVHAEKIARDRETAQMEAEQARRLGADMASLGWVDEAEEPDQPAT